MAATQIGPAQTFAVEAFDDNLADDERLTFRVGPPPGSLANRVLVRSTMVVLSSEGVKTEVITEFTNMTKVVAGAGVTQAEWDNARPFLKKVRDWMRDNRLVVR